MAKLRPLIPYLIIITVVFLLYWPTLRYGFTWDDDVFIFGWPEGKSWQHLPQLLKGSLPETVSNVYRPMRSLIYVAAYQLWHINPAGYHFQALLVHSLNSCLVFLILKTIFARIKSKTIPSLLPPLLGSLLFALHPVQTEAITFITASFDLFSAAFFFLSLYLWLKAVTTSTPNYWLLLGSYLSAFLAFAGNELSLTLPLFVVAMDYLLYRRFLRLSRTRLYVPYFILAASYFLLRTLFHPTLTQALPLYPGWFSRLSLAAYLALKYFTLTLIPHHLTPVHSLFPPLTAATPFDRTGLSQLPASPFLFLLLFASLIAVVLYMLYHFHQSKQTHSKLLLSRSLILGFVWFFIGLLPVLQFIPQSTLFAQRYTYLSFLGLSLTFGALPYLLHMILPKTRTAPYLAYLPIFILLGYAALTPGAHFFWRDNLTLWTRAYSFTPQSYTVLINLGKAHAKAGQTDSALAYFNQAINQNPHPAIAYANAGALLAQSGQTGQAITYLQQALERDPEQPQALNNLGILLYRQGDLPAARNALINAAKLAPSPETYTNLGHIYLKQNLIDQAAAAYRAALALNPSFTPALEALQSFTPDSFPAP